MARPHISPNQREILYVTDSATGNAAYLTATSNALDVNIVSGGGGGPSVLMADDTANPTIPQQASFLMLYDQSGTWDRLRSAVATNGTFADGLLGVGIQGISPSDFKYYSLTTDHPTSDDLAGSSLFAVDTRAFLYGYDGTNWDRIRGDSTNGLDVDVTRLIPGTTATSLGKAEDAAHTTGDTGVLSLAVRNDAAATLTSTDGDYTPLATDAAGRVGVTDLGGSLTVDGTVSITANSSVNVNQIGGNAVNTGTGAAGTGTQRVVTATDSTIGTVTTLSTLTGSGVAHDAIDSGNPHKFGYKAESSLATVTLVADADRTDAYGDLDGVGYTRPYSLGDVKADATSNTDGTSTASAVFTAVASTKNCIDAIHCFRTDAGTTPIYVDFRDGTAGSVLWRVVLPPNGGAVLPKANMPYFRTSANTALAYDVSAATTTVYINVSGFQSKL